MHLRDKVQQIFVYSNIDLNFVFGHMLLLSIMTRQWNLLNDGAAWPLVD